MLKTLGGFKVEGDIFSFLSRYGLAPMFEDKTDNSINKIYRNKNDVQCNVYSTKDICKFIAKLTKIEYEVIFNQKFKIKTIYNVVVCTNSKTIINRLVDGIYNNKNDNYLNYNTIKDIEFNISCNKFSDSEYTINNDTTVIFYNPKVFAESMDDQCVIIIKNMADTNDYKKINLLYDKEKDIFIESKLMRVDCTYAKNVDGVSIIKSKLISDSKDISLECTIAFDSDIYLLKFIDFYSKEKEFIVTPDESTKCLIDTLNNNKKETVNNNDEAELIEVNSNNQKTSNEEVAQVKIEKPSIAVDASYTQQRYRQTAGGYNG